MSQALSPIYLDYAATTPTDPRVIDAMLPYFSDIYGNPMSSHSFGRKANKAVEQARAMMASLLNCQPHEIIFTSCGTESDNMVLRGLAYRAVQRCQRPHLITTRAEHHAISHTADDLVALCDAEVTWLPVQPDGMVTVLDLQAALRPDTTLVSIMYANNEVGTIQPIATLAAATREHGVLLHTDAVQAVGQLTIDVQQLGVDLLSLTAHKFYGPKGVGALYVRSGIDLPPCQTGGSQEGYHRAGTHNVPLIVGMAKALELAYAELESRVQHYRLLRDKLIHGLLNAIDGIRLTGAGLNDRLPNHASFVLDNIDVNALLMNLDMRGISASSGSACNTGSPLPSDVLLNMGYAPELATNGLRMTVGRYTSDEDIDYVIHTVPEVVARVRQVRAQSSR